MKTPDNQSLKKRIISVVLTLSGVIVVTTYLELFGWRIIQPNVTLSEVWGVSFFAGVVRTVAGASLLGFLFLGFAYISGKMRKAARKYFTLIWCIGAALFLLVMALLIYWAPM